MPKLAKNFLQSEIAKIKKEGLTAIGHVKGLCVKVSPTGLKTYVFRYSFFKKNRVITIGDLKIIKLNQAKAKALLYRSQILELKDPYVLLKEKKLQIEKENNKISKKVDYPFFKVFNEFITFKRENGAFKNNKRGEQIIKSIIINHVYPILKFKSIKEIEPIDIHKILKPIWTSKIALSERLVSTLKQIFSFAQAMRYIDTNPVNMDGALGVLMRPLNTSREEKGHYAALDYKEIPEFCFVLYQESKTSLAAKALLFSILTVTRSQAVRFMKWDQIDFKSKIWTIPIENDKSKQMNRNRDVFLSTYAIKLLRSINFMDEFVFINKNFKPFSDAALCKVIKVINQKRELQNKPIFVDKNFTKKDGSHPQITQHGTARATFKIWSKADELGNHLKFYPDAVELCLLHERKDPLKGAYDRSKFISERRFIMEEWGKYCFSLFHNDYD